MVLENIIGKINSNVNRLTSVSNRLDSSKVSDNNTINDVPSADLLVKQQKIEPTPTKSTIGLLGFSGDSGDLKDRSIKGQVIPESDLRTKAFNDVFGKLQVNTKTDGVVQTKTLEVDGTMLKTVDQRKLAASSQQTKEKIQSLFGKLQKSNGVAIQKATTDEFVNGFSTKNNKQTIQSSSGIRVTIDGLNAMINEKISGLKNKKKETKSKAVNQVSETKASPAPSSFGLDLSRLS